MSIAGSIVLYVILWWVILFMTLPLGVRTPEEAGEDEVPGQADSAPTRPRILFKFALTTGITTALFVLLLASVEYDWINWRGIFDPTA